MNIANFSNIWLTEYKELWLPLFISIDMLIWSILVTIYCVYVLLIVVLHLDLLITSAILCGYCSIILTTIIKTHFFFFFFNFSHSSFNFIITRMACWYHHNNHNRRRRWTHWNPIWFNSFSSLLQQNKIWPKKLIYIQLEKNLWKRIWAMLFVIQLETHPIVVSLYFDFVCIKFLLWILNWKSFGLEKNERKKMEWKKMRKLWGGWI